MTPAETLAAARLSPVGPFVQARAEGWTADWSGPALVRTRAEPEYGRGTVRVIPVVIENGCVLSGDDWFTAGEPGIFPVEAREYDALLLDPRRPECRDLLVRHGCPSWARDCAPAVWAWAGGVGLPALFGAWEDDRRYDGLRRLRAGRASPDLVDIAKSALTPDVWLVAWANTLDSRAKADLAALRAGCVLEEADGWYVPGDTIGWWPKNLETP